MNNLIDETHRKICLKIKMERTKRDWTQVQLADFAQINKNTVGAIERNEISPSAHTLLKIAYVYNMTISELTDVSKINL